MLLTFMFRMLESLLSLDSIYTLTLGGPGYATFTMTYYIYTLGLRSFNLGRSRSSTLNWIDSRGWPVTGSGIVWPSASRSW